MCTENLTPFLKLLPCKGKAGIASLLDGHKLFDASWQSMAIDVRSVCPADGSECSIEMEQTVDMVLDVQRSKRPRGQSMNHFPIVLDINVHRQSNPASSTQRRTPLRRKQTLRWLRLLLPLRHLKRPVLDNRRDLWPPYPRLMPSRGLQWQSIRLSLYRRPERSRDVHNLRHRKQAPLRLLQKLHSPQIRTVRNGPLSPRSPNI